MLNVLLPRLIQLATSVVVVLLLIALLGHGHHHDHGSEQDHLATSREKGAGKQEGKEKARKGGRGEGRLNMALLPLMEHPHFPF